MSTNLNSPMNGTVAQSSHIKVQEKRSETKYLSNRSQLHEFRSFVADSHLEVRGGLHNNSNIFGCNKRLEGIFVVVLSMNHLDQQTP